jgi:hypothetical protein
VNWTPSGGRHERFSVETQADAMTDQTQVSRNQVEPDATGAAMLLERLERLYEQVIDEATVATCSYIAELGARAAIEDRRGCPSLIRPSP